MPNNQTTPTEALQRWFTYTETETLISQICQKLQLCNIEIGDEDDQLLLMCLLNDLTK